MAVKTKFLHLSTLLTIFLVGCFTASPTARYSGAIVSHVDSYGSGTGGSHQLAASGQMDTGFDYGDTSIENWRASVKWSFLRREGNKDVYTVEWNFKPHGGSSTQQVAELSFDGVTSAVLTVNEQLVISIEPDEPAGKV